MASRNDGIGESNKLQNEFTTYLLTAIRNRKIRYLSSKEKLCRYEQSLEIQDFLPEFQTTVDIFADFSILAQIENSRLQQAIKKLKEA